MDQLHYYFRKADKSDFKGIREDCEEQFRVGAENGLSEEEVCCKLGAPKNIYRYYIGKPIIPEENPRMPDEEYESPYWDPYDDPYERPVRQSPHAQPYDWDKDPARQQRRAESQQYYRQAAPRYDDYDRPRQRRPQAPLNYEDEPQGGDDFQWDSGHDSLNASKVIVNPFLQILGTLFYIGSGFLFLATAAAIIACIAITSMPLYLYTDLLPLPTLSTSTMAFTVLALLVAAMTSMYAGQACHSSGQSRPNKKRRGR